MAKRVATTQISDRNPYPTNESSESEEDSHGSQVADREELARRKISKPRSLLSRTGASSSGTVPTLGNLFAGLPTNPFNASSAASAPLAPLPSLGTYDNMRGLNASFMASAKQVLERKPDADLSNLFLQYNKHKDSFSTKPQISVEPSSSATEETAEASSMKKPVISGSTSEEEKPVVIDISNEPATKSFTFGASSIETAQKPFVFGASAEQKPFTFGTSANEEAPKPFTFGMSSELKPTAAESKPFTFGATTESKPFSFGTTTESTTESKPFSFGTTTESKPFTFGTTTESTTESKPFTFGTTTESTTESKPFTFGEQKPFTFGSTSEQKPFFFGTMAGQKPVSFGASSTLPNFSIMDAYKTDANSDNDDGEIPAEEAESFNLTRSSSEQLKTGAGEENETCQHEERCKIYLLQSETKEWTDLGVGIFKINRFMNAEGKSRILCRAEGSGKVTLNVLITAKGTEASLPEGKKEIALMCIGGNGHPEKYLVRVKTVEQAAALNSALQTEIIYVQSFKA